MLNKEAYLLEHWYFFWGNKCFHWRGACNEPRLWPFALCLTLGRKCVCLCENVWVWDSPQNVFAGGETDSYRDSGLAQPKEGEREWEWEWETEREREVDGGVVKLTVPLFTQVLPSLNPGENEQNIKNTKEQVKPLFPLVVCFRLPALNTKTMHPFVCSRSLPN